MARVGQRTQAGEVLALAGEPQMQAGNFISTESANAVLRAEPTVLRGTARAITVARGVSVMTTQAAQMIAIGQVGASRLDIEPPGDVPPPGVRDVWMYQTFDDGNVYVLEGDLYRTDGLETAVYLSLYGGNPDDNGTEGNRLGWWGNDGQEDPARQMVSRFQNMLEGAPLTSGNILRFEDAAAADLAWLEALGYDVLVSGQITGKDRLKMTINIDDEQFVLTN